MLTPELFAGLFGGLISILFSWVPIFRVWYASLEEGAQQGIMLGTSVLLAVLLGLSSCYNFWEFIACDKAGLMKLAEIWLLFLFANQTAHKIVPKPKDVQAIKAVKKSCCH